MPDFDDVNDDPLILDPGDGSVIADAVAPEAGPLPYERIAEGARVAVAV